MKEIIVNTQQEMDAIDVKFDGVIKICGIGIKVKLRYKYRVEARENSSVVARENSSVVAMEKSSVVAWGNSSVEARENSSVVAWGNSSVEAWENSSVKAMEKSSVVAWGNSSVVAWGNSSVVARENSSVVAWGNSSVEARENSSVKAMENSSVVAWGNSSVVAWGNSSVVARGNVCVRIFAEIKALSLFGFSVLFQPFDLKFKFKKEKTCRVQKFKPQKYLDREGISVEDGAVILFKRVSSDFKTQESTKNETLWAIGSTVTHPSWNPTSGECGKGKFHACSRPYFCDEFRSNQSDKYVAIKIEVADLHEWENPQYPHKIAFREGVVLYECDNHGRKL